MTPLIADPSIHRALFRTILACQAPRHDIQAAAELVATGVARISGGATIVPIRGAWATDASLDLARYQGPFEIADGVAIEITVPLDRVEELYDALPSIVTEACQMFWLPARWIHTDVEINGTRIAAHFRIGAA